MEGTRKKWGGIAAMAIASLAVLILYLVFIGLALAPSQGVGDGQYGKAMAALTAFAALWILLLVLLVVDRVRSGPSWRARLGYFVVSIAGIAASFATDYPHDRLCELALLALPLMAAIYALLGWLPHQGAKAWSGKMQWILLLLMAGLSAYPIERFTS